MNKTHPHIRTRVLLTLGLLALVFVIASITLSTSSVPSEQVESKTVADVSGPERPTVVAPLAQGGSSAPTPTPRNSATIFYSAEQNGRWEIYATLPDGTSTQITRGYSPARAPAISPDGKLLAFQSREDGNWEIYTLRLDTGEVTRVTNALAYDGAPAWSPDGKQLAFESFRSGDLDLWIINIDGTNLVNLTPKDPAYDDEPAWSPQGNWIAYTSFATGHKQINVVSSDSKNKNNISTSVFEDEQPAWSPDGNQLAFVSNREGCEHASGEAALSDCQRRGIFVADFDGARLLNARQLTFSGRDSAPAWTPDGKFISFISPRPESQPLYIIGAEGGTPRLIRTEHQWIAAAAWSASEPSISSAPPATDLPLYTEKPIAAPASSGHPYELRAMKEVYLAPSWGTLSSRVANSFLTLKARTLQESGNDFLSTLADMTRPLDAYCPLTCSNLSWHKSGRAVDTRLEYFDSAGRSLIELVREDELGETYWRLYLRAAKQDGSMGEPLKDAPWDFSARARQVIAPGLGGIEKSIPYGYYIDFTELAREYGWERISSHDDPDFDWRTNKLASEYWHYQKSDGLSWYQAMQEIYPPADLEYNFDWNKVQRVWGLEEMRVFFRNIPAPPTAWKWFALLPSDR